MNNLNSIIVLLNELHKLNSDFVSDSGMYFLNKYNEDGLCSDIGAGTIGTSEECRSAVLQFQNLIPGIKFLREEKSRTAPKGCYLDDYDKKIVWNNHQHGSRSFFKYQICLLPGRPIIN